MKKNLNKKKMRATFTALLMVWLFTFVYIEGLIVINSSADKDMPVDYLIVLGAGLKGDQISLALLERMEKSTEYLNKHSDVTVVVSGGQGIGETITEAEAMKRYLVSHGIAADRIIIEDKATSTMENFKFSREKLSMKTNKIKVAVITNDFHLFRAKMLAKRNGFEAYGVPCKTPVSVVLNCYLREYFAVIKSYFFDK